MKIKNLFKKLEAANFIASRTHAGHKMCISCDYIDNELNITQTFMNEAYCGPARDTFESWDEFEYTVKEAYTKEFAEIVMNTPIKESAKMFVLETEKFTLIFDFWNVQ